MPRRLTPYEKWTRSRHQPNDLRLLADDMRGEARSGLLRLAREMDALERKFEVEMRDMIARADIMLGAP